MSYLVRVVGPSEIELVWDNNESRLPNIGNGAFGTILEVRVEYRHGVTQYTDGKGFTLNKDRDSTVAMKTFGAVWTSRLKPKYVTPEMEDTIEYIKSNTACRGHFVPACVLRDNSNNPFIVMRKVQTLDLSVDTDAKLRQIIDMHVCLKKNYIKTRDAYTDYKADNMGFIDGRVVFLDIEEFTGPTTMGLLHGFELTPERNLLLAYERKSVLWTFLMYVYHLWNVHITPKNNPPFETPEYKAAFLQLFKHLYGVRSIEGKTRVPCPTFHWGNSIDRVAGANQNSLKFPGAYPNPYAQSIFPLVYIFIDIKDNQDDSFSRYRRFLGNTLIPEIQAQAPGALRYLHEWRAFLLQERDEDITFSNLQWYLYGTGSRSKAPVPEGPLKPLASGPSILRMALDIVAIMVFCLLLVYCFRLWYRRA